jgi:hypothetical protein
MAGFREDIRIIPHAAKVTAWVVSLALSAFVSYMGSHPPDGRALPLAGKLFLPLLTFAICLTYILLVGYVNGDAKRRGMSHVMWTLFAIFIPEGMGFILYLILRDPLPATCPRCGTSVPSKFVFCPSCGTSVKPTCPHCGNAVQAAWAHRPRCGSTLPGRFREPDAEVSRWSS